MARVEAVPGVEPGTNGYKALVLPLNYTAINGQLSGDFCSARGKTRATALPLPLQHSTKQKHPAFIRQVLCNVSVCYYSLVTNLCNFYTVPQYLANGNYLATDSYHISHIFL